MFIYTPQDVVALGLVALAALIALAALAGYWFQKLIDKIKGR